jgi:hypothetical protein
MSTTPVQHDEILVALSDLQNKITLDPNDISMNFLKQIVNFIIIPLQHVFTCSLAMGIVPSKMKIAKVIPIFKSGDPADLNNYRPISLLCSFSKIL